MTEGTEQVVDGLLLTRDLMFTSKVTSTALALGFRVEVVGSAGDLRARVEASRAKAVFVDLAPADLDMGNVMEQLNMNPRPVVVAFGSHVDTQRLQAAFDAGCDEVMARSKFSATLPELLQRVLN